jgi:hypothetical protein
MLIQAPISTAFESRVAGNPSFGDRHSMTVSGEGTNALARELNVAALGINMTV